MVRVHLLAAFLLIAASLALPSPPIHAAPEQAYTTELAVDAAGVVTLPAAGVGGATISMGSATVATGGQVTVDLAVTPDPGTTVAALDVQVNYDNSVVIATGCTPVPLCNPAIDPDTVGFMIADLSGLSGVEGTITFQAVAGDGTLSALDLAILTCADDQGSFLVCVDSGGEITVVDATPTPMPTPAPTPTITPGPTASPPPQLTQGNVDCSTTGPAVSAVDALKVLRFAAQLPVSQTQPCLAIGSFFYWTVFGNVDCSAAGPAVSAVDALKILRSAAHLPVSQTEPCPDIGTTIGTEPPPVSPPQSPPILGPVGRSGAIGGAAVIGLLASGLTLGFLRVMNRKRDPGDLEV